MLRQQIAELCNALTCEEGTLSLKSCFSTVPWRTWLVRGTDWHPLLTSLPGGFSQGGPVLNEPCSRKHSHASLHNLFLWALTSPLRCYFVRQNKGNMVLFRRRIRFLHRRALSPKCMPNHQSRRDTLLHSPEWTRWLMAHFFKSLLQNTLELKHYSQTSSFSQRRCKIDGSN